MPTPPISRERARAFVELVEAKLREGHVPVGMAPRRGEYGALRIANSELGYAPSGGSLRLQTCEEIIGRKVDWSLWRDPNYRHYEQIHAPAQPGKKPVIRVKMPSPDRPSGPQYRVLAIGDAHDSPRIPNKSRFKWIGKYANDHGVPYIRQIGDWGTFDSCSQYDDYGTVEGVSKPTFMDDAESLEESVGALISQFDKGYEPDCLVTLGNHEHRVYQWEDQHPETAGMMVTQLEQGFGRGRFRTIPYGGWDFLGGVGFTHVPFNKMGKPYGGKSPENMIANDAMFSVVYGHTHVECFKSASKIGPQKGVDVINLGCALPFGHVEPYAITSTTGWWYGIKELLIQGGRVVGHKSISMLELEKMYG